MEEHKEVTTGGVYYFAHPYTCKDKDGNYVSEGEEANFVLATVRSAELMKRGYNIYSPITHTHPIHRACPEFLARHEHMLWYKLDNEIIDNMNWKGIILAPGWQNSKGCRAELDRIGKLGGEVRMYSDLVKTPIVYGVEDA